MHTCTITHTLDYNCASSFEATTAPIKVHTRTLPTTSGFLSSKVCIPMLKWKHTHTHIKLSYIYSTCGIYNKLITLLEPLKFYLIAAGCEYQLGPSCFIWDTIGNGFVNVILAGGLAKYCLLLTFCLLGRLSPLVRQNSWTPTCSTIHLKSNSGVSHNCYFLHELNSYLNKL